MPKGHKPTEQARLYAIPGANPNGIKHGKLAPRNCDPALIGFVAQPVVCIVCGEPRDPRAHPVCDDCSRSAA